MSEPVYIRPEIVNGKLILVDQDGREVRGVKEFTLNGSVDELMYVDITLFAHSKDGKLIR